MGKVPGFVKQSVIAWAFGASVVTDLYFAADGFMSMLRSNTVLGNIIKFDHKICTIKRKKNPDRGNAFGL